MAIELNTDRVICTRCGRAFGRRKGNFYISYAALHRGVGYLPICRECTNHIFDEYLSQCNDARLAVRQMCRKLDIYWDDKVYESIVNKSTTRSVMAQYLTKLGSGKTYSGKSYDDTLESDCTMWNFADSTARIYNNETDSDDENYFEPVSNEVIAFWGSGYTQTMYRELEQRRKYWMSKFPEGTQLDIGTEAIIRQICSLELDINRDRAAGRAVDKSINALNTLLGSANLKPVQRKDDIDASLQNIPMGVWLDRFENKRPLPNDKYDDSQLLKYVYTWMGHLCKMLGIKDNKYTRLYEEAINKYRVEKPEYEDDDDDDVLLNVFDSLPDDD